MEKEFYRAEISISSLVPERLFVRPSGQKGENSMMHHEMPPGMQQHDMLMMEMWEMLSDDQKKTLMKRMLDSKIMMKEGMIKHFQFKIETMKMIKTMLDEC
jgi:hypothetical protein